MTAITEHDRLRRPVGAEFAQIDAPMSVKGSDGIFWSHFWVLKGMVFGAVCWVADKTGKGRSGWRVR